MNSQEKFKEKVLQEFLGSTTLLTFYDELKEKAKTIFGEQPTE
jgi:hypothetical protein